MANKERRRELEEQEHKRQSNIAAVLAVSKKEQAQERKPKRQSARVLFTSIGLWRFVSKEIRRLDGYRSRSYNLERQKRDLLKHLYVRYPIPVFMYDAILGALNDDNTKLFQKWFFCMAQGGSFRKAASDLLSRAEASLFLNAPMPDVYSAFWYAKMKNRGVNDNVIVRLLRTQIFAYHRLVPGTRLDHVMNFYARYQNDLDTETFDGISDYISNQVGNNPLFTLQGRTLSSVIALSDAWHTLMSKAKYGKLISWQPKMPKPWEYEEKAGIIWEVVELADNHSVINEGRKQHNCVSAYVDRCHMGLCRILSLRRHNGATLSEYDKSRVTIEVKNNTIVQAKGRMNAAPGAEEMKALRRFATEKGLTISTSRW